MTAPQRWRKSSYSSTQTNCVELAHTLDAVRDSKNGDVLALARRSITALLHMAKRER